jgi:hypothetical protein
MEYRSGSIYMRTHDFLLEEGSVVEGHCHNFDHTTFFFAGKWRVTAYAPIFAEDGKTRLLLEDASGKKVPAKQFVREVIVQGGHPHAWLLIEAGLEHKLELIEGFGCYACVYSHRTPDGDVTEEYTGWAKAYN